MYLCRVKDKFVMDSKMLNNIVSVLSESPVEKAWFIILPFLPSLQT